MRLKGSVVVGMIAACSALGALTRSAHACGGGVVTKQIDASVGDTQRVVMSMHDGVTDIVVQIGVPETTVDYGALLPEPYEPMLDPNPVPASELDELDRQTAPQVFVAEGDGDGGGIGCFCSGSVAEKGGDTPSRVAVSQPTDIGPVTAVVLNATDGAGVRAWLGDNGFAMRAEDMTLVDEYSGSGRYFIAIKRNETTPTNGPTSIGIHFRLPVAHAELPLRFARLGAAAKVTFSVFLFGTETLVPAAPFETTTLAGLNGKLIQLQGYAAAVEAASTRNGGRGFVLEGSWMTSELDSRLTSLVSRLGVRDAKITRLATILSRESLEEDAHFTETFVGDVPRERFVSANVEVGKASAAAVWLVLLLRRPKRRRGAQRSA